MKRKPYLLILVLLCTYLFSNAQLNCAFPDSLIRKDTIIICADTTYKLVLPNTPGISYTWGDGQTGNSINIHQSNKYWVTATDGICPLPVTDTVFVLFNSLILIPDVKNELLCLNQPAQPLKAVGKDLKWYTTAISLDASPNAPVPSTSDTGMAYYYVSQTILGCESPRAKVLAEVIEKPNFTLGENIIIPCGATGVVLQTVKQKYTDYTWQDGSTNTEFLATEAGNYALHASNICGSLDDTVSTVVCNTRCMNFPNAFTPNGDGKNDNFKPGSFCPITKYDVIIYNRFGQKMFESKDPKQGWDGKVNGRKADEGTYIYYCVYDDFMLKRELMLKGSVTLMK